MPELPEVEAVAQTLRPLVEGRRIRCIHVLHPIATKPQDPSRLACIDDVRVSVARVDAMRKLGILREAVQLSADTAELDPV